MIRGVRLRRVLGSVARIALALLVIIFFVWFFGIRMPGRNIATAAALNEAEIALRAELVAAGLGFSGSYPARAELYDPASGTWSATGSLTTARKMHTATLLPNGKVLVAGSYNNGALASVELYDPASGTWTATSSLNTAREEHTATLLPNGKVLVAGGLDSNGFPLASAELYDVGLGFSRDWQPKIDHWKLTDGKRLLLKGSLFQGISQASGGNTQDSSSNYPIVQLRSIDSGQIAVLPVDPRQGWSDS